MADTAMENPFGFPETGSFKQDREWFAGESEPKEPSELSLKELVDTAASRIQASRMGETISHAAFCAASAVQKAIEIIWESTKTIVTQAVKMAMFKFAIEACAMGIKSLVELMTGMNLTPPHIDTKGVHYNFGTGGTGSTPVGSSPGVQPSYGNPFGSPYGGSPSW